MVGASIVAERRKSRQAKSLTEMADQEKYGARSELTIGLMGEKSRKMGQKVKENSEAEKNKTKEAMESASQTVQETAESAKERTKYVAELAKEKASAAKERAASLLKETGESWEKTLHKTKEMIIGSPGGTESQDTSGGMTDVQKESEMGGFDKDDMGQNYKESGEATKEETMETAQSVEQTANERAESAKKKTEEITEISAVESTQEKTHQVKTQAGRFLETVGEKVSDALQKTKETLVGGGN